jgi:hypothetical protein
MAATTIATAIDIEIVKRMYVIGTVKRAVAVIAVATDSAKKSVSGP